ncbi:hypothetical protein GNI_114920 [Gregarina niphandrodes]|uniref:Uncharacterized protein n=1 Tax=Gregarina niphandrodes TaxID=110365 RepID=A0A023B3G2_GRENI|nr:hypothetical protein GNI_114920 [Gregarina niphandrodes]EZG55308.1 hypothetical protein GNI_114920 [Gregarina niphandrodes]|eukprot:XP_011131651.1 hypothetical protein GNI_114920 [Gregarina niphandrodes]
MRTLECKPAWFEIGMVGMLAGATEGERGSATVLGQWSRDIWMSGVGEDLKAFLEKNENKPRKLLEWFQTHCTPRDAPENPRAGGPFLTRRQLEEYEQRQADLPAMQWLHRDAPADDCQKRQAQVIVRALKFSLNSIDEKTSLREGAFEDCPPSDLYPEGLCGFGRLDRSPSGLVNWAYFWKNREDMSPEQELRTLAVIARWHPASVLEGHIGIWKTPLYKQNDYIPDLSVHEGRLRQLAALWFCGDPNVKPGPITESVVADLERSLREIEYYSLSEVDRNEEDDTYFLRYVDVEKVKKEYLARLDAQKKRVSLREETMLERRYCEAYTGCRDKFLSTYFPDPSQPKPSAGEVPEFPLGSQVKITNIADYQNYELRRWAWMEELLVRTVLDQVLSKHTTNTGEALDAAALVAAKNAPEPFIVSVSRADLRDIYDQALPQVAKRVAVEQAHEYACRTAGVLITTAYNQSTVLG